MKNWDILQTAYQVAKLGTVTAAAEKLDMQRATVIRHIDNLELELGTKLFQRHGRGYTPTDIGKDLLQTAKLADAEFKQLKARTKGHNELQGEFIVTSLEFMADFLLPTLAAFQQQHPKLLVRYLVFEALAKLEYGQAHIAIRTGKKPTHPDYVVQAFTTLKIGLYAHQNYVAQYGIPKDIDDFHQHQFITVNQDSGFSKTAVSQWLKKHIPASNIVLQSNSDTIRAQAIQAGMGIGAMLQHTAQQDANLIEMHPAKPDWQINNWITTHGDLHRSEKVQKFLQLLRTERQK